MRTCKIKDCERTVKEKGFCNKHYQRFWKHGDPLFTAKGRDEEKHGMAKTPEYVAWAAIKARCYNKNNSSYYRHGGRGILVCQRWIDGFVAFYKDMGLKPFPKAEIDRIDNNGNYEPGNCRWTTAAINSQNGSRTKLTVEIVKNIRNLYALKNISCAKIGNIYGVSRHTIQNVVSRKTWKADL